MRSVVLARLNLYCTDCHCQLELLAQSTAASQAQTQQQMSANASKWDAVLDTLELMKNARLQAAAQAQAAAAAAQAAAVAAAVPHSPARRGSRPAAPRRVARVAARPRSIGPLTASFTRGRRPRKEVGDNEAFVMDDGAGQTPSLASRKPSPRAAPLPSSKQTAGTRVGTGGLANREGPMKSESPAWSGQGEADGARPVSATGSRRSSMSSMARSALDTITDNSYSDGTSTDGSFISESEDDRGTVDVPMTRTPSSPVGTGGGGAQPTASGVSRTDPRSVTFDNSVRTQAAGVARPETDLIAGQGQAIQSNESVRSLTLTGPTGWGTQAVCDAITN